MPWAEADLRVLGRKGRTGGREGGNLAQKLIPELELADLGLGATPVSIVALDASMFELLRDGPRHLQHIKASGQHRTNIALDTWVQ